ncbi:MAG TPA: sugar phosphate isomerase/epimerase family protein [Bryobacteraceae bacterium]|nr:sugar phosphate isomerase/epimerase family protein [Bryobacteraceae bacterium]HOQ46632.1 sugar phosphate isomerase/epimerase family protein [Bryobacteraceae bacterium]HPQ14571.1 sugar phosphate isomerase/epimerase family protein [Bryobacteraceae bacterium]HPU72302.1 sugar phosphate isomerase/epimerase family protein [Bryobacteraceae bacterium]
MQVTRREFITAAAASAAIAAQAKPALCIFSKHLANLNYDELGKTARQLGFDGVDLTVRTKAHVLPERAAQDMPRAVEAIRSHGLSVPMITTELVDASHPTARPILATAARLKVPYFKPGYYYYRGRDVETVLEETRRRLAGLAALAQEYGIQAGVHNHSGDYVGEAVWDIRELIRGMDPKWIGYYLDPCHATIEGGLAGWQVSLNLVMPRLKMVALKDFYWAKKDGKWIVQWCPMGEGMVNWPKVFAALASARFAGPLSLHVEYHADDELAAMARDVAFIRKQLAAAYGA